MSYVCPLQEIKLTTNVSTAANLSRIFNYCDNEVGGNVDCESFLRHPVEALTSFDHVYTAAGHYWVTVSARGFVLDAIKSDTVMSNISLVVRNHPTLICETGLVYLLVPDSVTYVEEPLLLVVLIQNRLPDIDLTVDFSDKWSFDGVTTMTNITLEDMMKLNRYRIAACSGPFSSAVRVTTTFFRFRLGCTCHQVNAQF